MIRAIRWAVVAVCVTGIIGMIVTSATDHNGAALTFGLITAVAILCQMVSTTVTNELRGARRAPTAGFDHAPSVDDLGADLELRIAALVDGGADEPAVRELVRRAFRLAKTVTPADPRES